MFEAIGSAKSVKLGLASNPESSSAWVKTLVDPAHAREYGCRGIPDENQQPTLVLCGRDTTTYTPYTMPGNTNKWFVYSDGAGWVQASVTDVNVDYVSDVYICQLSTLSPCLVLYLGYGTYRESGTWIIRVNYTDPLVATQDRLARLVSQSTTVSWVGKEIDRAGYFEAGYYLPKTVDDGSSQRLVINISEFGNLVSTTMDANQGVYAISTFNDYDIYRYWKGKGLMDVRINILDSEINLGNITDYISPQGFGGIRPYFIHYSVYASGRESETNNSWGFRVTTNQVVERLAAYKEGGADAALYDRASVEDMITLYDSFDLLFPASYNDFKKVWAYIKRNGPRALSLAANVMKHFPQTKTIAQALDMLVGDAPRSIESDAKVWTDAIARVAKGRTRKQLPKSGGGKNAGNQSK